MPPALFEVRLARWRNPARCSSQPAARLVGNAEIFDMAPTDQTRPIPLRVSARIGTGDPAAQDASARLDMHVRITDPSLPESDPDYLAVDVPLTGTLNPSDENMNISGVIRV
jgi:hypothetical protein